MLKSRMSEATQSEDTVTAKGQHGLGSESSNNVRVQVE